MDIHTEALRVFREVTGVERALLQQIVAAIEPQYLSAMRNRQTNSIIAPISDVLEYLQITYGKVMPQMLQDKTDEVTHMTYSVHLPIDNIFNAIS